MSKRSRSLGVLLLVFVGSASLTHAASESTWKIKKAQWSSADESAYSDFIQKLGESTCVTTGACLDSEANPYRARNPSFVKSITSDCSRFPYLLRLYFAFMNDLPFSYVSKVSALGRSGDIAQSPEGNTVVSRRSIKAGTTLRKAVSEMMSLTSSGMYRLSPREDMKSKSVFPDFYPVAIERSTIRPGTLIYDPNGHVAMVYKVDPFGRVRFMDAHPDNSITRGTYGERFARGRSALGAGLKNWRPITLTSSGEIIGAKNAEIADFSLIQYTGTHPSSDPEWEWRQNRFVVEGVDYEFYDYIRLKLSANTFRFDPIQETRDLLEGLCFDLRDRIESVQEAVQNGVADKEHPETIPSNIYGSDGEWGVFSTPSRDARLKLAFLETQQKLKQFLKLVEASSDRVIYNGGVEDLRLELKALVESSYESCRLSYRNSRGDEQSFGLADIEERLWDLSFDPYHCPELRWGARGAELESCRDSSVKRDWYGAQLRLRARVDRSEPAQGRARTLADLWNELRRDGSAPPPPVDFLKALGLGSPEPQ
jgi:hypothetical protein